MRRSIEKRNNVRQLLYKWAATNERLLQLQHDLQEKQSVIDALAGIGAQRYDAMPKGNTTGDPTGNAAIQLAAAQEELETFTTQLRTDIAAELRFQKEIDGIVNDYLSPLAQAVIRMRYMQKIPYFKMAQKTFYSEVYLKQVEAEAVDILANYFELHEGENK